MKNLFFISLFFIQPVIGFSQTKADYEHKIMQFMKFYNHNQPDSITSLFSQKWGDHEISLWNTERINDLTSKYGKMKSYKYLELHKTTDGDGGGDGLAFFKVVFTKSTHIMSITLDKQNQIYAFQFKTTSPHIDSQLKKSD